VFGVIVLFLGVAIAPSINANIGEIREETSSLTFPSNLQLWEEEIHYYNPDTVTHVIGYCDEPPYYWSSAIRFSQDELAPYTKWELTRVKVALSCDDGQDEIYANLTIWGEGTSTQPGSIIYEDDTLYFNKTGFHIIELSTPIPLNNYEEIWIGIDWEFTVDVAYIPFTDDGPHVDKKGCWVSQNGGKTWTQLSDYGLDYNWAMGAIVEYDGTELSIVKIDGPFGVNAGIKNIGNVPAYNVEYYMSITGGIFGMINKTVSGIVPELAPDETIPIYSDLIFGLGIITIDIKANASNANEVFTSENSFILGIFLL
jgi:hypothetical protein